MMHYSIDTLMKYFWVALIAVLIAVLFIIIVLPNAQTRSTCTGFQYFLFLNQKATSDNYSLELLNGVSDIRVSRMEINGADAGMTPMTVKAGDIFLINGNKSHANAGDIFSYSVSIAYDTSGIKNNKDTATCTGKIQ